MDLAVVRDDMVDSLEHESKGVLQSERVARAMRAVPRHEFVEDERHAYSDTAHRAAGTRVLSPRVHATDIDRTLVYAARENLDAAGYGGVLVDRRDGARGFEDYAPFDRVLVEAAAVRPPRPLLDQLAPDGRLVMPQGNGQQSLQAYDADGALRERFGPVVFNPLLVEGEQATAIERNRTAREDRERAEQAADHRSWKDGTWMRRDY